MPSNRVQQYGQIHLLRKCPIARRSQDSTIPPTRLPRVATSNTLHSGPSRLPTYSRVAFIRHAMMSGLSGSGAAVFRMSGGGGGAVRGADTGRARHLRRYHLRAHRSHRVHPVHHRWCVRFCWGGGGALIVAHAVFVRPLTSLPHKQAGGRGGAYS